MERYDIKIDFILEENLQKEEKEKQLKIQKEKINEYNNEERRKEAKQYGLRYMDSIVMTCQE